MRIRREYFASLTAVFVAVMLTLAVGIGLGWQVRDVAKADESAAALARSEVDRFFRALTGDGRLEDVLGDAFQLMRTDGRRYDREGYLAGASVLTEYSIGNVEAARSGTVLTATFFADVSGTVGGEQRETAGQPRMAVFTEVDGGWKLQAFANLGQGIASGLETAAAEAVQQWLSALKTGNAENVREVLAPEFQIVRSDGTAYGAEEYLASGLPKIDTVLGVEEIVATGFGDHMIVRYGLGVKETLNGKLIDGTAPRMTVFRRQGDTWLVVAHANFARPQN